jgi:hypothetical protein
LRPFFRRLQRVAGIPVLPLISFVLCLLIVAGSGFRVSFFPVFFVTALVFVFGLIRLARLVMGLPTDWYKPTSVAWNSFLLALFACAVVLSFVNAPETGDPGAASVGRTVSYDRAGLGLRARYVEWNAVGASVPSGAVKPVVLLVSDVGARGRGSAALEMAAAGYAVLGADFAGSRAWRNPLMGSPDARQFRAVAGEILKTSPSVADEEELAGNQEDEIRFLVDRAREIHGPSVSLYAIAEGRASQALFRYLRRNPAVFQGSVAIVNSSQASALPPVTGPDALPGGYAILAGADGMMPAAAAESATLVITGADHGLYGLGELAADDVLAAKLLGGSRDAGRKTAVLTGRRIVSWLSDRRSHERQ